MSTKNESRLPKCSKTLHSSPDYVRAFLIPYGAEAQGTATDEKLVL